jgi:hypothetical protein
MTCELPHHIVRVSVTQAATPSSSARHIMLGSEFYDERAVTEMRPDAGDFPGALKYRDLHEQPGRRARLAPVNRMSFNPGRTFRRFNSVTC